MVAYLFAGQGSQYIGMGKDLCEAFSESNAIFEKASQVLGFDLKNTCCAGNPDALKMTNVCQPAVLTVDIAAFEAFIRGKGQGSRGKFVAGLSLGEYAALVAAGVLDFAGAVKLVRKRAELMNAVARKNPGKMAAIIGMETEALKKLCADCPGAYVANLNCPGQAVISGKPQAIDRVKELSLAQGAKRAIDLEVSGAFHSPLMQEAADEFGKFLDAETILKDAQVPVVSNVDAKPKLKAAEIKTSLVRQIYSPVLWEDSMRLMLSQGVRNFVEFGPGKVLKGLMRKIDPEAEVISIEKREDIG